MRLRWIFLILVLAGGAYWGWSYVIAPSGRLKVSFTPSGRECFQREGWKFCIHRTSSNSKNVAYYLHGRNQNELQWNDDTYYTALVQKLWAETGVKTPIVVGISFGPLWLLTKEAKDSSKANVGFFMSEVIPEVEKITGTPAKRIVFGESMGGINALSIFFASQGEISRVASLCPQIYKESPFHDWWSTRDFLKRSGADPRTIYGIRAIAQLYGGPIEEWNKTSPMALIKTSDPKGMPDLYLSCGLYDKYGNFEGVEEFARIAKERGFKIDWRPLYGGHCAIDIPSLAEFLSAP